MTNEVMAWIQTTDDPTPLRVLRQAIDERLADLEYVHSGAGGAAPAQVALRRTEPLAAGSRALPLSGPSPAPTVLDEIRARANQQVHADAAMRMKEAKAEAQGRAQQLAREEPVASEGEKQAAKIVEHQQARQTVQDQEAQEAADETSQDQAQAQKPPAQAPPRQGGQAQGQKPAAQGQKPAGGQGGQPRPGQLPAQPKTK